MEANNFKEFKKAFANEIRHAYDKEYLIPERKDIVGYPLVSEGFTDEQFDELLNGDRLCRYFISDTKKFDGVFQYTFEWLENILSLLVPKNAFTNTRFFKVLAKLSEYSKLEYSKERDIRFDYPYIEGVSTAEPADDSYLRSIIRYANYCNFSELERIAFEKFLEDNPQISMKYYIRKASNKLFFQYSVFLFKDISNDFIRRNAKSILFEDILIRSDLVKENNEIRRIVFSEILENTLNYIKENITGDSTPIKFTEDDVNSMVLQYIIK